MRRAQRKKQRLTWLLKILQNVESGDLQAFSPFWASVTSCDIICLIKGFAQLNSETPSISASFWLSMGDFNIIQVKVGSEQTFTLFCDSQVYPGLRDIKCEEMCIIQLIPFNIYVISFLVICKMVVCLKSEGLRWMKYFHSSEGNWPHFWINSPWPHEPRRERNGLGLEAVQEGCSDIRALSLGSQERICLFISPQGSRQTKTRAKVYVRKSVGYG